MFYEAFNRELSRRGLALCFILSLLFLCITSCSSISSVEKHEPATVELMALADKNPEFKSLLVKSIALAKSENPDRETNPAQTLDEFYAFIDWAAVAMPWNILKDQPYPLLYEQIDQSLDYFYFAIDRPLSELEGKGLYRNSLQYYEPFRSWMIKFTKSWGAYLDTTASWNNDFYKKAYADKRFGLDRGWYEDPSKWTTFNQFFARYLKSPDQRPIAQPGDQSVVVAPADSVPQGVWKIDTNSNLVNNYGVEVKSSTVYSIKELLGDNSAYKGAFANGVLTHTFLDVNDYHRYHFPVGGTVKEINIISQDDAVGGTISWSPEKKKYLLDSTTPGWQFIETRGYVIIQTEKYGLVAVIPVGMSQVSSVNFEKNVQVGVAFNKGDMLGYFLFGGSDIIMLFQEMASFRITAPVEDTAASPPGSDYGSSVTNYKHILMGEKYGVLTGQTK
jgi:phosphatidylserine decarboxylase